MGERVSDLRNVAARYRPFCFLEIGTNRKLGGTGNHKKHNQLGKDPKTIDHNRSTSGNTSSAKTELKIRSMGSLI